MPDLGSEYEVQEVLGEGGMGKVYLAVKSDTKEKVAVKVLRDKYSFDEQAAKRFEQEVEAVSNLDHPNLAKVIDHGKSKQNQLYMVMEYVPGRSLDRILIRGKRLTQDQVLKIMFQLCDVLEEAHENGVVHRDIKPSNVIVDEELSVKLIDFGIAKLKRDEFSETIGITKTGEVFGSPLYMSPEQCLGMEIDSRSDIYSLGCLLCELVTGQVPFKSENPIEVVSMHLSFDPVFSSDVVKTTSRMKWVVIKCLTKNSDDRYQSLAELKHDLELIKSGKRTKYTRQFIHAVPLRDYRALGFTVVAILSLGFLASYVAPVSGQLVALVTLLWIIGVAFLFSLMRCILIGYSLSIPLRTLTLFDLMELFVLAGMINSALAIFWSFYSRETDIPSVLHTLIIPVLVVVIVFMAFAVSKKFFKR